MMDMIWQKTEQKLLADIDVMLLVVVKSSGSSPGKSGFKLMVSRDGETTGSVGGGAMEFNLIRQSLKMLEEGKDSILLKVQEHKQNAGKESSGLVCSGIQYLAFYPLKKRDAGLIREIIEIEQRETGEVVAFTKKGVEILKTPGSNLMPFAEKTAWLYFEQPGLKETIYIFGGGHVSLALSEVMKLLDFKVMVFDNRTDLTTMNHNKFADELKIVDYKKAGSLVPDGDNVYVVIMTFAHQQDYIVLKQMLSKRVKYLGMMGSHAKVESVRELLRKEGLDFSVFTGVFDAPVGVRINSITPMEIAFSVAAKIIDVKNG
jgi:xanthine dehydrogenase accessory factor